MTLREHYEAECRRVSIAYGIPLEDIQSRKRGKRPDAARTMVAYKMREVSPDSLQDIGDVMGITHTSVLRLIRKKRADVEAVLVKMMTKEDLERAAEQERLEQERIAAEIAALEDAASRVKILGTNAGTVEKLMTSNDHYKRRWGLALHHTRKAKPDDKDAVFKRYVKDLFPLTWQTPSALCA